MLHQIKNVIPENFSSSKYSLISVLILGLLISACGGSGGSSSGSKSVNISGKINVQRDSDVDIDLNNVNVLNNDLDNLQIISNPTTLGGYLSGSSGTYAQGAEYYLDLKDLFSVTLVEGQTIQLSLFQADDSQDTIELELAISDQDENVIASLEFDSFRSNTLIVPQDGFYTLSLSTAVDTSPVLYILSVSQTISNQTLNQSDYKNVSRNFVPGEVLIKFKSNRFDEDTKMQFNSTADLLATKQLTDKANKLLNSLSLKDNIPGIAEVYAFDAERMTESFTFTQFDRFGEQRLLEKKVQTMELIKQLQVLDQVEFAEPNFIYSSTATTNDPRIKDQWGLNLVSTNAAWEVATGDGVIVAVLDTGINASHEDLINKLNPDGYDFISSSSSAGDGNGFDSNPEDLGSSFHGSHVAGIIAAEANNNKGIAGIAYDAEIMPLRVLGVQDTGNSSDIAQAILYAAGLTNSSGVTPSRRADIINMSFGGEDLSQTIKAAIDSAYAEGLILIAAAGNQASDIPFYPAAFDNVIGVGSVSNDKQRSSFSNFGQNVQVVAPGGTGSGSPTFDGFEDAILSSIHGNNYTEYLGTSMSAPHVSAVVALMKELKTDLNGGSFISALNTGSLSLSLSNTPDTSNFFGNGLIDAAKAVNWAAGNEIIPATLKIYPNQFGFIGANTEAELSLTNPGNGTISIVSIDEQDTWLAISPIDVSNEGLGRYLVEVSPLQSPVEQGTITINYQVNSGDIQQQVLNVFVSRSTQSDSTVGVLFVSLFKEEDLLNNMNEPFVTVGGQLIDGVYDYCFTAIPSGRYLLTASTDNDGDQVSFDPGEAVGSYPLQSRPEYIDVNGSTLEDMDFDIQYPSIVTSSQTSSTISLNTKNMNSPFNINNISRNTQLISQSTCLN